jgi:hypothetical protein
LSTRIRSVDWDLTALDHHSKKKTRKIFSGGEVIRVVAGAVIHAEAEAKPSISMTGR